MNYFLTLPYPPSVNRYWRKFRNRMVISKEGKDYKSAVEKICRQQLGMIDPSEDRVTVSINAHPPDKRRRDLDNLLKALLDAMEGTIYVDDAQIDKIEIMRSEQKPGGLVEVQVDAIRRAGL